MSQLPPGARAVIFVNGIVDSPSLLSCWLRPDDYLIGADGGTVHCLALGLTPHVIVGDFDSLAPDLVRSLTDAGVEVERHPPEKDKTDLDLAIDRAVREGVDEVLLLGALGGRLDQTLANLLILARRDWPIPLTLAHNRQLARTVQAGERLVLTGQPGDTVSAIPLTPQVTGITYTGLRYALSNATLPLGSSRGVSNEMAAEQATVQVASGILLVIQESG